MNYNLLNERFVTIEPLTGSGHSHKLAGLVAGYSFAETFLGEMLIGSTSEGVCYLAFVTGDREASLAEMTGRFPGASFEERTDEYQRRALAALSMDKERIEIVPLHLRGSDFQMRVWKELLKIPFGETTTYSKIAAALQNPKACRAVGSAIGDNPVSVLIPCHRVLRTDGTLGGYHWGLECKTRLLEWERERKRENDKLRDTRI